MVCNKVAFINGKGGCSKTTSIFHIAGVLADKGEKVLVIDFDKQRNSTDNFLAQEESEYDELKSKTVLDYMTGKADIKEVVKKSYIVGWNERKPKYRNIDVLPADVRLENEKLLRNVDIKVSLNKFIEEERYTWVLIDMPPSNKTINDICFEQIANYIVVPFSSDIYSISGYGDIIDTVNRGREKNEELHILGIFLSRYMENCGVDRYIKDQAENMFGEDFINVQIPLKADVREAVMFHKPISFYKKWSASKTAYEKLVEDMKYRISKIH